MGDSTKLCRFLLLVAILLYIYYATRLEAQNEHKTPTLEVLNVSMAEQDITISSQNIWLHSLPMLGNHHAVKERLEALAKSVGSCHIVFLQEMFVFKLGPWYNQGNYKQLEYLMKMEGFLHMASSQETTPEYFGQNSGLVIYSKYRIARTNSWVFKESSFRERINNKGFIVAELITTSQRSVYLVNTHLEANDREIRKRQLEELIENLSSQIVREGSFVILAGDLNIQRNSEEFDEAKRIIEKLDLQEVFTKDQATCKDGTALDHMFVSRNIFVRHKEICHFVTQDNEPVSDHYALWVNLKMLMR